MIENFCYLYCIVNFLSKLFIIILKVEIKCWSLYEIFERIDEILFDVKLKYCVLGLVNFYFSEK